MITEKSTFNKQPNHVVKLGNVKQHSFLTRVLIDKCTSRSDKVLIASDCTPTEQELITYINCVKDAEDLVIEKDKWTKPYPPPRSKRNRKFK